MRYEWVAVNGQLLAITEGRIEALRDGRWQDEMGHSDDLVQEITRLETSERGQKRQPGDVFDCLIAALYRNASLLVKHEREAQADGTKEHDLFVAELISRLGLDREAIDREGLSMGNEILKALDEKLAQLDTWMET